MDINTKITTNNKSNSLTDCNFAQQLDLAFLGFRLMEYSHKNDSVASTRLIVLNIRFYCRLYPAADTLNIGLNTGGGGGGGGGGHVTVVL